MQNQALPTLAEAPVSAPRIKQRRGRLVAAAALFLVVLLSAGFVPRFLRMSEAKEIARATDSHLPVVLTVEAHPGAPTAELTLPANIEAVYVASLDARTNGYVKRRLVDIGQRVRAGQLLAEIESPEVDQQLAESKAALGQSRAAYQQAKASLAEAQASVTQCRASLDQASANQDIAKTTDLRWSTLVARGVIARQQGDEKRSAYHARLAEVAAAQANILTAQATVIARQASIDAALANIAAAQAGVRRLEEMVAFERVVAPFDGVITERKVERGDLVTAGTGSAQTHLFSIAQADVLRIQTQVPQSYASDIQDGQTAEIQVRGPSAKPVIGKVARSANALNAQSRTLLVEVQVDNREGLLLPGMYADVKFVLPRKKNLILVPADTLVVNAAGTSVVTVSHEGKIHYRAIQLGRDLGAEIEVLNGLSGGERLVSNPVDSLKEGQSVQIQSAEGGHGKA